jgi:hypothetical protein
MPARAGRAASAGFATATASSHILFDWSTIRRILIMRLPRESNLKAVLKSSRSSVSSELRSDARK